MSESFVDEFSSMFRRLVHEFEEQKIDLISSKDHPEISLGGIKIGPLVDKKPFKTRLWIAKYLIAHGFASLSQKDILIESREILKNTVREGKSKTLGEISPDFYIKAFLKLSKLKIRAETEGKIGIRKKKKLEEVLSEFLEKRAHKVAEIAVKGKEPGKEPLLKNMSLEEKWLFEKIRLTVNSWKKILTNQ
ncbi:MAG: hypothetical protein Q6362_001855 [Candidatus Wukongarchaeota archaeon]|nr:hypothetical protein [Candidatus Wukongarchaeota archaeon]